MNWSYVEFTHLLIVAVVGFKPGYSRLKDHHSRRWATSPPYFYLDPLITLLIFFSCITSVQLYIMHCTEAEHFCKSYSDMSQCAAPIHIKLRFKNSSKEYAFGKTNGSLAVFYDISNTTCEVLLSVQGSIPWLLSTGRVDLKSCCPPEKATGPNSAEHANTLIKTSLYKKSTRPRHK